MIQPTGSVYLDTPTPSRRQPTAPKRTPRVVLAGALMFIGFLGLTVGAVLVGAEIVLRNPASLANAVDASLDERLVQEEIEQELVEAIETSLVGTETTEAARVFGFDVQLEATRLAPIILADPDFRAELSALIIEGHQRILLEPRPDPINLQPLTDAVVAVVEAESAELARILPAGNLIVTMDEDSLPDLTSPASDLNRIVMAAFLVALAIPLAAIVHPRRHRVLAWSGRWLLTIGFAAGLVAVGLPYLASSLTGFVTLEMIIRGLTVRLLGPAAIAGVVGMALVSTASVLQSWERRRLADKGAEAALGVNEPALVAPSAKPQLDLTNRGLVDVNHPLTNI